MSVGCARFVFTSPDDHAARTQRIHIGDTPDELRACVVAVAVHDGRLDDGRSVAVPIDRYPILSAASVEQRNGWGLAAFGTALRWEAIDEDISIEGILRAPEAEVFAAKRARRASRGR